MVDIVFKTNGAWGAGKGSRLTSSEVDGNFYSVKQAIEALQDNPAQPLEIVDATINGYTITFLMSDLSSTFEVTVPAPNFAFTDAWQEDHDYSGSEFFTADEGLYITLQGHHSGLGAFDPNDGNLNGPYYRLVIPFMGTDYEIPIYIPGAPGEGATSGSVFFHLFVRSVIFPVGAPRWLARLVDAPTDDLHFNLIQNGTLIGTLTFAAYETEGIFDVQENAGFVNGDIFELALNGEVDVTANNLTIMIVGVLGDLT